MRRRLIAMLLISGVGGAPAASSGLEPVLSETSIGYRSVTEAFEALQYKTGVETRVEREWTIVSDPSTNTLWWFAARSSPAYPAAVFKRSAVQEHGAVFTDVRVECEANQRVCFEMVRQFQKMNGLR